MSDSAPALPRLTFVSGPDAATIASWLSRTLRAARVDARCAVLAATEIVPALARDVRTAGEGNFCVLKLPCPCCPACTNFSQQVRDFAEESGAAHLFVALPALMAAGLVAEFDARTRLPREFVFCLNRAWATTRLQDALSYFQFSLLSAADRVVEAPRGQAIPLPLTKNAYELPMKSAPAPAAGAVHSP